MKAFAITSFDASPEFVEVPRPDPLEGEILIRVLATSINPVDLVIAGGAFRGMNEYRFPAVFGRDVCGVVESIGANVTAYRGGEHVWGFIKRDGYIGDGTFAEYVTSPQDHFVVGQPSGLAVPEAGVLGLTSITALESLAGLGLSPGDTVFVSGAEGGVGSCAVQIAVAQGLKVIATARPGERANYLRDLGAEATVDWTTQDIVTEIRRIAANGVQGYVDLLQHGRPGSGDEESSLRDFSNLVNAVLARGGRMTSGAGGFEPRFLRDDIGGLNFHSSSTVEHLKEIGPLVEAGALHPRIAATYDFDHIEEAIRTQQSGVLGKVSVVFDERDRHA
jgi:NADPH:quinone reductase